MTKLEEFKEIWSLYMLQLKLMQDVTERLQRLTPTALEAEANEAIRMTAELELITQEANEKWKAWEAKYGPA
jgi:hypothetical protein